MDLPGCALPLCLHEKGSMRSVVNAGVLDTGHISYLFAAYHQKKTDQQYGLFRRQRLGMESIDRVDEVHQDGAAEDVPHQQCNLPTLACVDITYAAIEGLLHPSYGLDRNHFVVPVLGVHDGIQQE
jgi:hypothetical protein